LKSSMNWADARPPHRKATMRSKMNCFEGLYFMIVVHHKKHKMTKNTKGEGIQETEFRRQNGRGRTGWMM
jgi:hypothetical protein